MSTRSALGTTNENERGITFDMGVPNEAIFAFGALMVVFLIVQIIIKKTDG
jgi:hypothetical protein